MSFPQQDRLLRISGAPFSGDDVLLTGLSGHESMSRLYSFQLEFVSTQLDLKAPDLIGKPFKVEIAHTGENEKDDPRFINGYISRLTAGDVSGEDDAKTKNRSYRVELVPWLWFLTQTARSFIYFPEKEEKSIFDIINEVFDRAKNELHIDPKVDLKGIDELKQRKVTHCVQYRETDFNFVSRILEQYGAYYYFTQKDGEHTLVVDMTTNYPKNAQAEIGYPHQTAGGRSEGDHINSWEHAYEFVSGKYTHTDYNFETPSTKLLSDSAKVTASHPDASKYEIYDYPGEYGVKGDGDTLSRARQEEEEVPHDSVHASSGCRTMMPGHSFSLRSHPDGNSVSEKGSYLITSIHHHASQPGPESGPGSTSDYTNSFTCVPDSVQFRPARITPKPVVSGIQTAVVVGPKGEEIHTDEYGRIMVAFHWDREDTDRPDAQKPRKKVDNGEKFFCWIRVAQNIAGNKWGFMAIPRIGQEVVVDFIEGDPDRPLVIGGVYNDEQMPHYDPREHKSKTYIKTNSTKGGEGFNELMFEDKMDEEQVFIHAEKNMDTRVKNVSKSRIIADRHQIIGHEKDGEKKGDQNEMVYQDKNLNIKRHQVEHIEGNHQLMIGNGDADDGGNLHIVIEENKTESVGADKHMSVGGNHVEAISGNLHQSIGGDHHTKVGGNIAHEAGSMGEIHIKAGMKVIIEAGAQLSLKGPGGFIDIGMAGISIQGTTVLINSGGAAGSGGGSSPASPDAPEEAAPTEPAMAHDSTTGHKSSPN